MNTMLYLDNAATTRRKPYAVYRSMFKYLLFSGGNAGRGDNKLSLAGVRCIIDAQEAAAELFGIDNESNIVFTSNATYALNTAILGTLNKGEHIVVTAMDHNSVLRPAVTFGNYSVASAASDGYTPVGEVRKRIKTNTTLVVGTHISNVCGTRQPVEEMARAAHAHGALFLLDASQSAGNTEVNALKTGADMIACAGHKGLMGPMGTGILYVKNPEKLRAVITGGTGSNSELITQPEDMPDKFHSGTMNIPAIAGLCEAIKFIIREGVSSIGEHERLLNKKFRENLMNMDKIKIYGRCDSGITAYNIEGIESQIAANLLGEVAVRAGYHCAPLAHKALGTENGGAVRVSFGYYNDYNDVCKITDMVYKSIKKSEGV